MHAVWGRPDYTGIYIECYAALFVGVVVMALYLKKKYKEDES